MPLVSLDDINVFLPSDKLEALDADDDSSVLDAERIIKGKLSGTFSPTVLASWSTPAATPETIRAIAGRLVAALYYARSFSEESTQAPQYSQNLYNEALSMLDCIVDGSIVLVEVSTEDQPSVGNLTSDDFLPNNDSPAPKFTMEQVW